MFDDDAMLREITLGLLLVARVVHDKAKQFAVQGAFADVKGQIGFGRRKPARLNNLSQQIGANLDDVLFQQPHTPRLRQMSDECQETRHDNSQQNERPRGGPDGGARCCQDDQLAVAIEAVQGVKRRDQKRKRRDDRHQVGQRQRRHFDQHPGVLALAGDDIELAQR